jgi:hypothetical protein
MSDQSKYPSYSAADIERYHKGQMSAGERHDIEKAALEDPFLSDAMDGYVYTSTPTADLEKIRSRINGQTEKKSKIIFFRSTRFMRAAAVVLLLAGAGWLITRNSMNKPDDLALDGKDYSEIQKDVPAETQDPLNDVAQGSASTQTAAPNAKTSTPTSKPGTASTSRRIPAGKKTITRASKKANNQTRKDDVASAPRLMEVQIQPDSNQGLMARANSKGIVLTGDTTKDVNIVLKESADAAAEVRVLNKNTNRIMPKPNLVIEPEPLLGWEHYNNYVINNLREPEQIGEKQAVKEVELSFDINQFGEPVNIKVEQSLCPTCNEEAIRILKQGPKWKNIQRNKARVTISF